MPESLTYKVHGVHRTSEMVPMTLEGRDVQVVQPVVVVELIEAEHGHTFRFRPENAERADALVALFAEGKSITVTFTAAEEIHHDA